MERHQSSDVSTKGRRVACAHCGHRMIVRGGQVWKSRAYDARLVIIAADRDGAIVEQLGRDDRFGISYRDLLDLYRKER